MYHTHARTHTHKPARTHERTHTHTAFASNAHHPPTRPPQHTGFSAIPYSLLCSTTEVFSVAHCCLEIRVK